MYGILFDIKESAVHDGPGIRQTVFLKGCPLRCSWCHNPEGLSMRPELMISPNGCMACGKCREVCAKGATIIDFGKPPDCIACGACVAACSQRIRRIVGEKITSEALAKRLMQNAAYYAGTGGGVTISGGEPLLQAAFVMETLSHLDSTVHTALETSGYGKQEDFQSFMKAFDLIYFDLKSMDDAIHKRFTGVSNRLILRNACLLCRGDTPFVIRIPVIPGVNDCDEHYQAVADLIQGAPKLQRVEFLPYHITAGAKYKMLQLPYKPGFHQSKTIHINQTIFTQQGIRSFVL